MTRAGAVALQDELLIEAFDKKTSCRKMALLATIAVKKPDAAQVAAANPAMPIGPKEIAAAVLGREQSAELIEQLEAEASRSPRL